MKTSDFFGKFKSWYLWGNLLAMGIVVVMICIGVKYALDYYTFHDKEISVPDVRHKLLADAKHILQSKGLLIEVSDTGYVKTLPPDCVLEQSIAPDEVVKAGRTVRVVINSAHTPTLTIPDIIDNSSYREARAKLMAMGFKVGNPNYIPGEKEWVYGIKARGRNITNGQKVSIEDVLIIQVGDGLRGEDDEVLYTDPNFDGSIYGDFEAIGDDDGNNNHSSQDDFDDFEIVTQPE